MQSRVTTDSLIDVQEKLGLLEKTQADSARAVAVENLAKYYSAMKPAVAAEALQADELNESEVASILAKLTPAKAGKIMGFMDPNMVASITKMIMDAKP